MITEDAILNALGKQMSDEIDREVLKKFKFDGRRFLLGKYPGEPCAIRVRSYDKEIQIWIEQHPQVLWRTTERDSYDYILDKKLYTMFLLRWS